jgi:hypothetical protein
MQDFAHPDSSPETSSYGKKFHYPEAVCGDDGNVPVNNFRECDFAIIEDSAHA